MSPDAAVAARLQSLFDRQNDSLADYARLMDAQEISLRADDTSRLEIQLEFERGLLDRLDALRRVSDAFESAYREAFPRGDAATEAGRLRVARAAAALRLRAPARRLAAKARQDEAADQLRTVRRALARVRRPPQDPPQVLDILR